MSDLYPVYTDIGGERKKVTAYMDIDGVRTLISRAESAAPIPDGCLTFSSAETFTIGVNNATKNWDGTLEYSTDTVTWSEWNGATAISSAEHGREQRIYMRGKSNTVITGDSTSNDFTFRWVITGNSISCYGNIENILDYEIVEKGAHPIMGNNCFRKLFRQCASLITAPELPATTLTEGCYYEMFGYCTSLTSAPELPATTLTATCYYAMFKGCTSLITATELPATKMALSCYYHMFYGCTSLTSAPELPATTLMNYCYQGMFYGCTSLTSAPELPATTLISSCYRQMFYGCTSLTSAPELPATTLANYCYYQMFRGCTALTTLPKLPATSLVSSCYYHMFYGCTGIKLSTTQVDEYQTAYRIPTSGTGTSNSTSNMSSMFYNTGGTFKSAPTINTIYYTANEVV